EKKHECWPTANNLTCVLNNLLINYNKKLRPNYDGQPLRVQIYMMIITLGPIFEHDMSYTMNCFFRQIWVDQNLTLPQEVSNISVSTKLLSAIWKPDTYFLNSHSSWLHSIPTANRLLRILENGRLLYSSRITLRAGCPMKLRKFPMDVQTCPLRIGSYAYSTQDVIYDWRQDGVEMNNLKLSQFDLFEYGISKENIDMDGRMFEIRLCYNFNGKDIHILLLGNHSVLHLDLRMRRHMGYYVLQNQYHENHVDGSFDSSDDSRIEEVEQSMVKLKRLSTTTESPLLSNQVTVIQENIRTSSLKKWSRCWSSSVCLNKLKCKQQRKKYGSRTYVQDNNSVNKLDRLSRIAFPLLFVVLNFVYWYLYLIKIPDGV
ncbi:unnamed protein product, partial [Didymodactylos carnosus]